MEHSKNEKYTLIFLLKQVAKADGEESLNERKFIANTIEKLNLNDGEIVESKNFKPEFPKSENDRIFFFFHALQMVEMDSKIIEPEIEILKRAGFKLGLNPLLVNDLIQLHINHLGEFIPRDKIPFLLKKYMN